MVWGFLREGVGKSFLTVTKPEATARSSQDKAAPAPPCSVPSASHRHGKAAPSARQSPRRAGLGGPAGAGQCLGERGRRAGLCAHGDQAGAVTKGGRVSGDLRKTSNEAGQRAWSGGPEARPCRPLAPPLLWGPGRSSPFGKRPGRWQAGWPGPGLSLWDTRTGWGLPPGPQARLLPTLAMVSLPWPHWLSSAAPLHSHVAGLPLPRTPSPLSGLAEPCSPLKTHPCAAWPPASPRLRGGGAPGEPGPVSPQTERLTAEQIEEYKGVFEMFDEEGNGAVKTDELERLMSLMGINPTKSELASMAKDVDRDKKGFFNCDSFLALMGVYWEKAQNQESELRAAFRIFDKEGKGYIDWDTLKYVLTNAGEPLSELEAERMMQEADKDGDGTIDYEGEWEMGPGSPAAGSGQAAYLSLCSQSSWP
ncbi:calmodulin-like protein 6 isoform X2 [Monodon monoceros]|uniref:calmodulin-like protein 6 isoform X2 n=1 Tax=Monodon monoceros TaxID=40151 RepID=UPI0010F9437A|nr:calmodulin-like protein 6 isoform X2 [Monodon monoceros]